MNEFSHSDAAANLAEIMDQVVSDLTKVVITRENAEAVVLVPLSEWNAVAETMHLLSTRANAARLQASIRQLDANCENKL
jgi:antitoxin YefM